MGRVEGAPAKSPMSARDVARFLLECCGSLREFESFMFGSSLVGTGNDFDILIVGPSGEPLSRLKAELAAAGKELPLDVLFMMPAEAKETDFVMRTGCLTLLEVADFERR